MALWLSGEAWANPSAHVGAWCVAMAHMSHAPMGMHHGARPFRVRRRYSMVTMARAIASAGRSDLACRDCPQLIHSPSTGLSTGRFNPVDNSSIIQLE
jgi:hypothetical protein